jgi:acyl-CoA reductase-like NAD-dependent aldehyde dehydrogenase
MAATDVRETELLPEVQEFLRAPKQLLIDGELVDAADGSTFETFDPSTGEVIVEVAHAQPSDIDRAVAAARRALHGEWAAMSPSRRATVIFRFADLIEAHTEELAQLEALDMGKPIAYARAADLPLTIDHFRYFAGWATKIEGSTIPTAVPDCHVYTRAEPIGVVGAIIPWNFPLTIASWKLAPALAAGCTVVLKPAEQTPLSAIRLGELALEAGIPAGVLNVCNGLGETTGAALAAHPDIDLIAFTGSTEVGKLVAKAAADTVKHVSLELGGKSPNIIFSDADVDAAAAAAAGAIFFNSGQVCSAGSRLFVEQSVYDDVIASLVSSAKGLTIGAGLRDDTTLGPLVSQEQYDRVTRFVEGGVSDGARLAAGGGRPAGLDRGYFVEPTVFVDASPSLAIAREEIFGPVVVAEPFESLEQVAARANDTEFGLSAGVWTRDLRKAHKLGAMLEAGTVWINCYNYFDAAVPFGGYKRSGYGRDGGRAALEKYFQVKSVWTNLG